MQNTFATLVAELAADIILAPVNLGPLTSGQWICSGIGMGFFVPVDAYRLAQDAANSTRRIQFLGLTADGQPIHGTRDECMEQGCNCIAWISPE